MSRLDIPNLTDFEKRLLQCSPLYSRPAFEVYYSKRLRLLNQEEEPTEPKPINIYNPKEWNSWAGNWLVPSVQGEWFVYVLNGCRRILDIGSGPGRPSLYLASHFQEVVGVEPGKNEIRTARKIQSNLGIENVTYYERNALHLRFEDKSFDGALFCYSLESTGDIRRALEEAQRVLRPGGTIAIGLAPFVTRASINIGLFREDDGSRLPVVYYWVMTMEPLTERRYMIHVKKDSYLGHRIVNAVLDQSTSPVESSDILQKLQADQYDSVEFIEHFCVDGIRPGQLGTLLEDLGFNDVRFWQLPSGRQFASVLQEQDVLCDLKQEHYAAYVTALACCCCTSRPTGDYVSAKKKV